MYNEFKEMRGQIILKLLELIQEGADDTLDYFIAYMNSNKRSIAGVEYELKKAHLYPRAVKRDYWSKRFSNMVYQLKKDGLIKKKDNKFLLTVLGKSKLAKLKSSISQYNLLYFYKKTPDSTLKIIAFDIPEIHKKKRNWLRLILREYGFVMVQKSLWMGKVKLPEEFFKELYNQKIDRYIKVFAVTKKGNLNEWNDKII